jgi:glycosyltransferase involved in cell wall biosynthesis
MLRRVLHVIPSLAARYGGPSAAVMGMCRALHAAGVSTLVATTDADGPGRLDVAHGEIGPYEGVPVVFFPRQASESFKWSGPLDAWLGAHVQEFDLVHIHAVFSHSSLAAGRACRRHGVPYVVRPLGTLDPWSLGRHPIRKKLLFLLGARALLARAAAVHYTSEGERRLAEQSLPWLPTAVIVPLGIDREVFGEPVDQAPATAPYVLAMSRLDEKKGLDLLINAFHNLASSARLGDWSLVVAGDGDAAYVQALRRLAASGAARARVAFRGWVAGSDRVALLRGAGLFALPSHQENFGIAMVEAMAAGVPVMVSPGVNLGAEIEGARAGWVVSRDGPAWQDAVASAISDPGDREERGRNARQFAERFRWPAIATALQSMYEDVLASNVGTVGATSRRLAPSP